MPDWKTLRLALIVIVEGILICNTCIVKASRQVVEMVKDLKTFEEYPWGRESFEITLQTLKVGKRIPDVDALVSKFNQSHTSTHDFTLAVQLFLFKTIPELERFIPDIADEETFTHESIVNLTHLKTFHNENIMEIENQPNRLIGSGFKFTKDIWRGGADVWPVIAAPSKKGRLFKKTNKGKGKVGEQSKQDEANRDGPFANVDVEAIMSLVDQKLAAQKLAAHTADIRDMYLADQKVFRDQLHDDFVSIMRSSAKYPSPADTSKYASQPIPKDSQAKTSGSADVDGSKNSVWGKYPGLDSVLDDLNQQDYGGQDDIMKEKSVPDGHNTTDSRSRFVEVDFDDDSGSDPESEHVNIAEEGNTGFGNEREEALGFLNHEEEAAQFDTPAGIQKDNTGQGGQTIAGSVELSGDDDSNNSLEEEEEVFVKEGEESGGNRGTGEVSIQGTIQVGKDKDTGGNREIVHYKSGPVADDKIDDVSGLLSHYP
ncbi:hypothetical protein AALP_AAs40544U000100 [Arabis alpina]|uniref:DUF1985 domain-containing protein n=1 Tax=Arabis alpina TaxID=50452 RepID=A0A087G062_ARAAL|nr:hypothetical protein AALP_AAs40544U000100 [Arabis alpina]